MVLSNIDANRKNSEYWKNAAITEMNDWYHNPKEIPQRMILYIFFQIRYILILRGDTMDFLHLFEIIFRCMLLLLIIYHAYKSKYKISKAAALTLALSFLPMLLNTIFYIRIDVLSCIIYYIILFMALYLGSSLGFYDRYQWWDRTIHCLSGIAFVGFGIAIGGLSFGILKSVILLLGFTFSLSIHLFWEVAEYISDCITHGNAQRWQKINASTNHVSEKAIQPAGLVDTMNDGICHMIGAAISTVIWWIVF